MLSNIGLLMIVGDIVLTFQVHVLNANWYSPDHCDPAIACKELFDVYKLFKRPARDACLCMGELQAPPAPPAPAAPPAPPAPPAPHFVFLITL